MVMNNGQWLIDFTGDTGLWNKEIINTNHNPYPSMIVWKYRKLYELSTAGNVYGVIFAAKDLFELCVKIPVLMSIIIIKNHPELPQNDSYKELMSAIVKQPLNSGDWRALAQHIFNNNTTFSLPDQLALILRNTCRLTNLKIGEYPDAIVWRNKTIAHGMLRFEDDPAYQTEVKEILEHFVNYFSDNRKRGVEHLYPDYYSKIDGVPVVGGRISASINNKIELFIHDIQYQEEHYILDCADEILFFESYND